MRFITTILLGAIDAIAIAAAIPALLLMIPSIILFTVTGTMQWSGGKMLTRKQAQALADDEGM